MRTQILSFTLLLLVAAAAHAQSTTTPSQVTAKIGNTQAAPTPITPSVNADELVRIVLDHNPEVKSALHKVEALKRRIPQVKALPDPRVSAGWNGDPTPFGVKDNFPPSFRSFQASQTIPFPGKLGLKGDIAGKEAEAAQWDYEAVRRRVTADVKTAYFQYFFFDKAIQITEKNRDLLTKLSEIAEARYRVGKGIQQDVLKAQTELSLILQRLTVLQQQRDVARARLNTLLSRSPDSPLGPAAEVQPVVLAYSLPELYEFAQKNDPGLHREQQMIERNQYAVNLAQKDYLPDLTVGYGYQQRPMLPDTQGLTFTVNIPIFYKSKQREAVKEAQEQELSSAAAKENRLNQVNFQVKQEYLMAQASQQLYELYAKGVVPQSSLALESSMSSYQVGKVDFLTILANFSNVLQYQVEYYRELANYETALARLEPLIGLELTTARPQSPLPSSSPKQ